MVHAYNFYGLEVVSELKRSCWGVFIMDLYVTPFLWRFYVLYVFMEAIFQPFYLFLRAWKFLNVPNVLLTLQKNKIWFQGFELLNQNMC